MWGIGCGVRGVGWRAGAVIGLAHMCEARMVCAPVGVRHHERHRLEDVVHEPSARTQCTNSVHELKYVAPRGRALGFNTTNRYRAGHERMSGRE